MCGNYYFSAILYVWWGNFILFAVYLSVFGQFYMSGGAILSFLLFIYLSLVNFICLVGQFYPFCCLFILFAGYLSVCGQFYLFLLFFYMAVGFIYLSVWT